MVVVSLEEAGDRLDELVEATSRGEAVTITRGGEPVAKIEPAFDRQRVSEAFAEMDRIRARAKPLEPGELRELIEEGGAR